METNTTAALASFIANTRFDGLPREVVHETKRILLDGLGCALGSIDLS
jgi:2-methylcitrate dehydratase PrpD